MNFFETLTGVESTLVTQFCNVDFDIFFFNYDVIWYNWISVIPHLLIEQALFPSNITYLEQFLDNVEDLSYFTNLENLQSIYHYSVPTVKLAYPEPFIASASFMHSDLWFVHILIYQYWLWFLFIFIIVFFFVTFLCTVRWCNIRVRPRRETRGVSRSKCGDLITACVPVSWAASIIINESTDAIDYYDGFGTTELVVGIRAYQWGWEYYYPKDIDLNYNIRRNYSSFIGNSLKYNSTSDKNLKFNNFWKYYQNKLFDQIATPAHLILLPQDSSKILNLLNFNDIGTPNLVEANSFKRSRNFFKNSNFNNYASYNYFSAKYSFFNNVINEDVNWEDDAFYGIKRQHNFLNSLRSINETAYLNPLSFHKFLKFNYNFKLSYINKTLLNNLYSENLLPSTSFSRYYFLLNKEFQTTSNSNFNNLILFKNFKYLFNNDSDKKKISKPFLKTLIHTNMNYFNNKNYITNLNNLSYNFFNNRQFFKNNLMLIKNFENFSSNQSILTNSKFIRKHLNVLPTKNSLNLNSMLNIWINNEDYFTNTNSSNINSYYFSKSKWINTELFAKLGSNKIFMDAPHSPIASNTSFYSSINYDSLKNTYVAGIPSMFQSKEDIFPTYLFSTYWNFFGLNSNNNHRILNEINLLHLNKKFYFPLFSLYYDYDFRNWQSIELLEDGFWESQIGITPYSEYKDLNENFYEYLQIKKNDKFYLLINKIITLKNDTLIYPNEIDKQNFILNYAYSLYNEDFLNTPSLISLFKFSNFSLYSNFNNVDDTYESFKNFYLIFYLYNKNSIEISNTLTTFVSTNYVFDWFRSNYEDFNWFNNFLYTDNYYNRVSTQNSLQVRFNYHYNLRSTVKNSIVNFNAMQKVFKSRLDDARSHSKLTDLNNLTTAQPFLAASRPRYEKLLGKTKDSFFDYNFYHPEYVKHFNFNFFNYQNSAFFDFPFLLGQKSDSAKHVWIDWYSKWGFYEVQPSSSSKYSIHGMPYFNKFFEFTYEQNDVMNETETYFVRLSKSRKNYLQNWIYTPYFFAKNLSWNKMNLFWSISAVNKFQGLLFQLDEFDWYWNDIFFFSNYNLKFFPSISNINSFTKTSWRPTNEIANYFYAISTLHDILTVREYLYRELFANTNKLINLPNFLTSRASTELINDLKSLFFYHDPIILNNEFSKDIYYNSLEYFNFNILSAWLKSYFPSSVQSIFNNFYYLVFNNKLISNNELLYKNQFRPLRKGINNMLRIQATGAIAMPIEIRLQVLASSKDVIHSWAVPSAGIKIDCVPGYSSHKVMIFLVSGIFWGQCMEICGRYHHWMPIVVYFMKRDLFFLWCTHFVFLSGSNNLWTINDRQFVDYVKVVSFDKNSWTKEIN